MPTELPWQMRLRTVYGPPKYTPPILGPIGEKGKNEECIRPDSMIIKRATSYKSPTSHHLLPGTWD